MSYNNGFNIRGWTDAINSLGACTPIFETVPGVGDAELTPTLGVRGRPLRATLGDYLGSSAEDSLNSCGTISSSSLWQLPWSIENAGFAIVKKKWCILMIASSEFKPFCCCCSNTYPPTRKDYQQMIQMVWDLPYSEELMYPHRDRESIKAHYWR